MTGSTIPSWPAPSPPVERPDRSGCPGIASIASNRGELTGPVTLVDTEPALVARAVVDPAHPVFIGHYPGFPLLPGVAVIDYVSRAARLDAPPDAGEQFDVVEAARFLGVVRPGDQLRIEARWTRCEDGWRCAAKVAVDERAVATVRLHYPTRPLRERPHEPW